jgi:hypothetical protein
MAGAMRRPPARPEATAIVGYPKCGNTWVQVMVRRALVRAFDLPDACMATVLGAPDAARERLPDGLPQVTVSHAMPAYNTARHDEPFVDLAPFAQQRVVLLVRDAADALVSLYMHNVHRANPPLFDGDLESMVHDPVFGLDKYLAFYRTWHEARTVPRELLLLRYVDLRTEPRLHTKRLLEFVLGPRAADALVDDAVAFGSFDSMRRLERDDTLGLPTMAPAPGGENARKVRSGVVGGARHHLSPKTLAWIHERVAAEMPGWYGYPLPDHVAAPDPEDAFWLPLLRGLGLEPRSRVLELECGELRASPHLVPALEPGGYVGVDRDASRVRAAWRLACLRGQADFAPRFETCRGQDLPEHPAGFDFVLVPQHRAPLLLPTLAPRLARHGKVVACGPTSPGSPRPLEPIDGWRVLGRVAPLTAPDRTVTVWEPTARPSGVRVGR